MNDPGNLRRRLTRAERRADDSGTLYVISAIWLVAGAAFFVAGVVVGLLGWGYRWLM